MKKTLIVSMMIFLLFSANSFAQVIHTDGFERAWLGDFKILLADDESIPPYHSIRLGEVSNFAYATFYDLIPESGWPGDWSASFALYLHPALNNLSEIISISFRQGSITLADVILNAASDDTYVIATSSGDYSIDYQSEWIVFHFRYFEDNGFIYLELDILNEAGEMMFEGLVPYDFGSMAVANFTMPYRLIIDPVGFGKVYIDAWTVTREPSELLIGGTGTGIDDFIYLGKPLSEWIDQFLSEAANKGQFTSKISQLANDLYQAGLITKSQRNAMINAAAHS
jgi:hypothetical protein